MPHARGFGEKEPRSEQNQKADLSKSRGSRIVGAGPGWGDGAECPKTSGSHHFNIVA